MSRSPGDPLPELTRVTAAPRGVAVRVRRVAHRRRRRGRPTHPTYDRPMPAGASRPTAHEVLAAVLQIRDGVLQVLAWRRAQPPDAGRWALPGGLLGDDEDVEE